MLFIDVENKIQYLTFSEVGVISDLPDILQTDHSINFDDLWREHIEEISLPNKVYTFKLDTLRSLVDILIGRGENKVALGIGRYKEKYCLVARGEKHIGFTTGVNEGIELYFLPNERTVGDD